MARFSAWTLVPAGVLALALGLGWGRLALSPPPPEVPPPSPPVEAPAPVVAVPPVDTPPPPEPPVPAVLPEANALPPANPAVVPLLPPVESWPAQGGAEVSFARLQTALNRAVASPDRAASPAAERFDLAAEALRRILAGDAAGAQRALDAVDHAITRRLPSEKRMAADPAQVERQEWLVSYFELLPNPPRPGADPVTAAFIRLAITLRRLDAVLLADQLPRLTGYDLVARKGPGGQFDGRFLRFPCRLAATERPRLQAAARALGQLAGPLTDCPVVPGRIADFTALEALARDPATHLVQQPGLRPPAPDRLATPLILAAANAPFSVIEATLQSGGDPTRADGRGLTAWHYLAINQTLTPTERAEAIKRLF